MFVAASDKQEVALSSSKDTLLFRGSSYPSLLTIGIKNKCFDCIFPGIMSVGFIGAGQLAHALVRGFSAAGEFILCHHLCDNNTVLDMNC